MPTMRTAARSADPEVESPREAYLRRVIERQPAGLTRIASDGTFLAVNDAALSMLGAARLDEVLETSVFALVAPEHRDQCRAFLARIIAGDRGSTEVDLTGLGGLRYTLQIHAVSLRSVTDSLASALCILWDVTGHRRLERALTEAAAHGEQQAAALAAERERLTAALMATQRAAGAASASAIDQARLAALEAALQKSEQQRNAVAEQRAAHEAQLAADFQAAQQQFECSLAEQLARITDAEAALRETGIREQALLAERDRNQQTWRDALAHAAAEHARTSEALQASVRALESSLVQAKAREDELVARHEAETRQLERTIAQLDQNLRAAVAERDEAIARHEALRQEHDALAQVAASAESARSEVAEQLGLATAERAALQADLRRLAAVMADGLHHTLAAAAHRDGRATAALTSDSASRPHADALFAGAPEAAALARRIRQAGSSSETDAAVGRIVQSLKGALGAVLSPAILSVLVGSTDTRVDLTPDQLEQLLMTLVANRRVSMLSGGRATLEVADVDLDDTCARERSAGPGAHVLLALHVSGPGVDTGLPAALFGAPAGENEWRAAGPGMAGLHHAVQAAGGHLWATREGSDAIAFEVYLPSVTSSTPATSPEIFR
jgi:PAS domain S-box-containing protein